MIKYFKHSEINKQKWDDAITTSQNGLIYSYSWYLDIVCPEWDALIEGDYDFVMPLTKRKKYGINYLFPPHFTQQLGIFSVEKISENKVREFLNAMPAKIKFAEINLNAYNKIGGAGFSVKENLNLELDLNRPYSEIHKMYSENAKRNLKKAEKNNLIITSEISLDDAINLFRLNKGRDISNLKTKDYNILGQLLTECKTRSRLESIGIKKRDGQLCAGAFFIESNNRRIFIFSASNEYAQQSGAMFFLIDNFVKRHSEERCVLDFEGSNNSNLARFYRSFGSKDSVYLQVKINKLPKPFSWIKK